MLQLKEKEKKEKGRDFARTCRLAAASKLHAWTVWSERGVLVTGHDPKRSESGRVGGATMSGHARPPTHNTHERTSQPASE